MVLSRTGWLWDRRYEGKRAPAIHLGRCLAAISLLCLGFVLLWWWASSPVIASTGHEFLSSISEAPPGTKLLGPEAVTVDHATGQVFVGDGGQGYVYVFSSSGTYETRFGEGMLEPVAIAVDEASGDVYAAEPVTAAVLVFEPDGTGGYRLLSRWSGLGTPGKAFGEVVGVAFDNSNSPSDPAAGDLYVVESESVETEGRGAVDLFKPPANPQHPEEVEESKGEEGTFVKRLTGAKLEAPNGVAVDSATGRVLVADSSLGLIYAFNDAGSYEEKLNGKGSPGGTFVGEEEAGNVAGLAVDEASGDIYAAEAERHVVSQYSASGTWLGSLPSAQDAALGEPHGLAVDSSGDVYVADVALARVDLFGPDVVIPDAETAKVSKSEATRTTAVLKGTVNGEGTPVKYRFEWGTTEAYGQTTPQVSGGTGEEAVAFTLEGLHAGTTYHFRIVGENENGEAYGEGSEFTTAPAVDDVRTGPIADLQTESATLTGSLKPDGFDAHYRFQWGTTDFYGKTSPEPPGFDAGSGEKLVAAETKLGGLSPNASYHYRLVAENSFGTTYGADQQFTTSGPPRIFNEVTTDITHEEAAIHVKINPGELATTYHFEYGETTSYGTEVPVGGQHIEPGSTPVAVTAALTKLKLGATYHFRVVASNSAGTTIGRDESFMTVASAPVVSSYATSVGATEATVNAQVDPLGHDTRFYFQYGTESCQQNPASCSDAPAAPGEDIGAGEAAVSKNVTLSRLRPNTTYYYRAVAENSLGISEGPEHTFTTKSEETTPALPDGRAWEIVSPVEKHGAPIEGLTREGGVVLAAEDGDALTYVADGAITGTVEGNRGPEQQQVLSTRTPQGWSSQDIATPSTTPQGVDPGRPPEYEFFTPDLSSALVDPWVRGTLAEPQLSPEARQQTVYLRDSETGGYLPLVTEANVAPETEFGGQLKFVAATPDLRHVVIHSDVALLRPPAGPGLYEWTSGQLQFISMLPDGAPAENPKLGYYNFAAHAISSDGTRVIWTAFEDSQHRGNLYMTDTATGQTLQLDTAQGAPEPEDRSARFEGATSDGSRVFFTDKQRLTDDSTAEPEQEPAKADLYECEVVEEAGRLACHLKDLTVDDNEGEHAAVQGFLLGASEDDASLYLVAQGVLAENENANGEVAQPGADNLYALHDDGAQWTRTFIARLSGEDKPEWEAGTEYVSDAAFVTARSSPNGRYLAFMSAAPVTGYDNVDANPEAKGARAEEVYLYDSATATLRCISCNPTGERPNGVHDTANSGEGLGLVVDRRLVWTEHWLAGNIPGWTALGLSTALFQSRYLSNEGRLFFNSPDDLVPQATNGKEDVYEYEPTGVGSCQSVSGGCIALISGGSSERESAFVEATPSGNDVFFLTEGQLLPEDTDTAFDIYDARVCTEASPCLHSAHGGSPACDEIDACRPAQAATQIPGGPAVTATDTGAGTISAQTPSKKEGNVAKTAKPLTLAEKLSKALAECRRQHTRSKKKRQACEAQAHKRYTKHTGKKSSRGQTSSTKRGRRVRR